MISKKILQEYISKNGQIKIAIAGAGYITKGLLNQISMTNSIQVVAMASRNKNKIIELVSSHNMSGVLLLDSIKDIPYQDVDIVIDLTGDVESGAYLAYHAILNKKHIICSAETDATVGPVLAKMAREVGVIYTNMWGDEPGLIKGLYDYADILGFEIAVLGKFKGYHDINSTPDSVKPWAELSGQNPTVVSSYADGTKLSMEMAILSNATGFIPDVAGMHLPKGSFEDVMDMMKLKSEGGILSQKGVIEVILGPEPTGTVFAMIPTDNEEVINSFKYYKMGDGPNYMLYYPYHLPGIEMIYGIYEMMLGKSSIEPLGNPVSDVISIAKRDLNVGDVLGHLGAYDYHGINVVAVAAKKQNALPVGLAKDAIVIKPIMKGNVITWADVEVCNHELCCELRKTYNEMIEDEIDE